MKQIRSLLLLIIPMMLFGCIKEPVELPGRIVTGITDNMLVNEYDTILTGGYNVKSGINLDLNNDSLADFRMTTEIFGSPGMGLHPLVYFMSLHPNSLMNGYLHTDTTFFHIKTDTLINSENANVYIDQRKGKSCRRSDVSDLVVSIRPNVFYLRYFNSGEPINTSDICLSDTVLLNEVTYYDLPESYQRNDTTFGFRNYNQYNCNAMPNDQIIYLGVKLKDSSGEKLGWVKLIVINQHAIALMETALQQ